MYTYIDWLLFHLTDGFAVAHFLDSVSGRRHCVFIISDVRQWVYSSFFSLPACPYVSGFLRFIRSAALIRPIEK